MIVTRRAVRMSLVAGLAVVLAGCGAERSLVLFDLRTDFVPHVEFDGVLVQTEDGQRMEFLVRDVSPFEGFRVAELMMPTGLRRADVSLWNDGRVVYERPVVLNVRGPSVAVIVVASRSCRAVRCADGEACVGGYCESAACLPDAAEQCSAPRCTTDEDCPRAESSRCPGAVNRCAGSVCLVDVETGCRPDTEWCDPSRGCTARPDLLPRLEIGVTGYGSGAVIIEPLGIECRSDCVVEVATGTEVVLRPVADSGSRGRCLDSCELSITGDDTRTVVFDPESWAATTIAFTRGGYVDGPLADAEFRDIGGVAETADGTILFSDTTNNAVRALRPNGTVETVAGRAVAGYLDGPPEDALFNQPAGLALLEDGTLLVADSANNRIRAIAPDRSVRTLFGDGTARSRSGSGLDASIRDPTAVALDGAGWLWVDASDALVRIRLADGVIEIDGPSPAALSTDRRTVPRLLSCRDWSCVRDRLDGSGQREMEASFGAPFYNPNSILQVGEWTVACGSGVSTVDPVDGSRVPLPLGGYPSCWPLSGDRILVFTPSGGRGLQTFTFGPR